MVSKAVIDAYKLISEDALKEMEAGAERIHHHFFMDGMKVSISIWKV